MKRALGVWIAFQEDRKLIFLTLLAVVVACGAWIAFHSELEAFPDVTNVQVQVITQYSGKASEEVERRLTIPIEIVTNGVRGLINQRSVSLFGLSVVTLTFDDDVPIRQARLDVSQRLQDAELPDGVHPGLSPESTPVGEIYRYRLEGSVPPDELRMIEDWTMERELKSIPGVADVVSFGGPTRTVEVRVNPQRLASQGFSFADVAQALGQDHANAGGGLMTRGEETYVVRSLGLFESPEAFDNAVIGMRGRNVPVRVRDVGSVRLGHRPRLGQVGTDDDDDIVQGIVLLRKGADTLDTTARIREKVGELNARFEPLGVKVIPVYDRTTLIRRSSHTVIHNVIMGIVFVVLLLTFGLGLECWPLVLAVALIIPFSLAASFAGMKLFGVAPNLISLGAVDFGIIVETAIFAAESVLLAIRHGGRRRDVVTEALGDVLGPAFVCAFLLVIAFVPILSLQRVEGRIFRPLGITLISALIGGQVGALIFVPFLSRFVRADAGGRAPLEPAFAAALALSEKIGRRLASMSRPGAAVGAACAASIALLMAGLGREFLPQLNEGGLWVRVTAPATISREAAVELAREIRTRLRKIPEVNGVVSQIGRPDDGTDSNGFDNIEFLVSLVHPDQWKTARTIDGLTEAGKKALEGLPGVDLQFTQYIKDNVEEAISGVKAELVIKLFGPDPVELQRLADEVAKVLKTVPGADDVSPDRLMGQPELRFVANREMLARYGLRISDAADLIETALQGKYATRLTDKEGRSVDVLIRPELSENPTRDDLAMLPVLGPGGARIPLGEIATPALSEGVARIYRETGRRRIAVKASVRGRPVVEFVKAASAAIGASVKLPPKYQIQWSGSFENAERAGRRLMLIVPLCVVAILLVLYTWFDRWPPVLLLLWEVPFCSLGGLAALRLAGLNLSISAAAGGIVMVGVSLLTGMMLISGWLHLGSAWDALKEEGRGILLSSGVAILGLVPAAFSRGIGAETARPFAVMILGGLITSLVLTLLVLPALLEASGAGSSTLQKD